MAGDRSGPVEGPSTDGADTSPEHLPEDVLDEAVRVTRLARNAVDEQARAAYRDAREHLLSEHDFTARVREDDDPVLVCYPSEWVEDGTVSLARIDDIDRGRERPLEDGTEPDDWERVHEHNRAIAADVAAEYGPVHGENARILTTYMSNHHGKFVEDATRTELRQFLCRYYLRNAWPTPDQESRVVDSLSLVFECADEELPL